MTRQVRGLALAGALAFKSGREAMFAAFSVMAGRLLALMRLRDFLFLCPGQFRITEHLVPSAIFGGVQGGISKFNQVALELSVSIENRDTYAYGEMLNRLRRTGKKFGLLHRPAEALGHVARAVFSGFRQDDDELFTAVTRNRVHLAHVFHQDGSHVAQHLVAYMVAKGVIQV